jgi:hypothetical protein
MLIEVLTILVLSIFVACFVRLGYYSIGEPKETENGVSFTQGRIFSFYGAFILKMYIMYNNKESGRIFKKFKQIQAKLPEDVSAIVAAGKYKPSLWMALGVCPVCFSIWLGLLIWIIVLAAFGLSVFWLPLAIPTSSMILFRILL